MTTRTQHTRESKRHRRAVVEYGRAHLALYRKPGPQSDNRWERAIRSLDRARAVLAKAGD